MDNWCVKAILFSQRTVKFRKARISESAYKRYRVYPLQVLTFNRLDYRRRLLTCGRFGWKFLDPGTPTWSCGCDLRLSDCTLQWTEPIYYHYRCSDGNVRRLIGKNTKYKLHTLLTRFGTRYDINKHLSASWSERINRRASTTKRRLALVYDQEITQLTFYSTNNREFEQIPLNWSLKLPLNCTSLREFRKSPLKSNVMRLFRYFLLDSLGNDISYRYSWSCTHFILK